MQKVLFATGNPHKLTEVAAVFEPLGIEIIGLDSLSSIPPEPDEDQDTFEGNAHLKARAYAKAAGCPCLADDSGLEVDALNGEPGVRSARWAGVDGTREERDSANNRLLVQRMAGVPKEQRHARFVCALCLVDADGRTLAQTRGEFAGLIVDEPRGENGFGYDPYLYLPEEHRTSAELTAEEKNARSHRGAATRAMAEKLARIESDEPA